MHVAKTAIGTSGITLTLRIVMNIMLLHRIHPPPATLEIISKMWLGSHPEPEPKKSEKK